MNQNKTALLIFLFLILVSIVHAQSAGETLIRINDFFENQEYSTYSTVIDFFLFFTIALATMLIGVKAIFPDQKRQSSMIAIAIALIATVSLVRAGVSVSNLLPYVGYALFFGLVVIIYFFMRAMGILKEKKGWAIVASLLIAFIIFVLLGWVFDTNAQGLWERFMATINRFGLLDRI
jgi:hypothetical protein